MSGRIPSHPIPFHRLVVFIEFFPIYETSVVVWTFPAWILQRYLFVLKRLNWYIPKTCGLKETFRTESQSVSQRSVFIYRVCDAVAQFCLSWELKATWHTERKGKKNLSHTLIQNIKGMRQTDTHTLTLFLFFSVSHLEEM